MLFVPVGTDRVGWGAVGLFPCRPNTPLEAAIST